MNVSELAPGFWRWTAPHPDWKEGADWEQDVGCVYYEAADATVLIDPLVPPERERFFEALDRDVERRGLPVVILLTCPWHERSAAELTERYGAGDAPPAGVEPFLVLPEIEETLWWLPEPRTLVAGDVLLGAPDGVSVCPDSWLEGRGLSGGDPRRAPRAPRPSRRARPRLARRAGARRRPRRARARAQRLTAIRLRSPPFPPRVSGRPTFGVGGGAGGGVGACVAVMARESYRWDQAQNSAATAT